MTFDLPHNKFWFSRNYNLDLPLISLQYYNFNINIVFVDNVMDNIKNNIKDIMKRCKDNFSLSGVENVFETHNLIYLCDDVNDDLEII
jgi:hypothetical protein